MARVAGTCYIKVDGQQLDVSGGIEATINDVAREEIMSATGHVGYKEMPVPQRVSLKTYFTADFPLEKIRSASNMTITCEFPNGRVYTLSNAYLKGEKTASSESGEIDLEFVGERGLWA
jgi:predicted heme/steroid binding protein